MVYPNILVKMFFSPFYLVYSVLLIHAYNVIHIRHITANLDKTWLFRRKDEDKNQLLLTVFVLKYKLKTMATHITSKSVKWQKDTFYTRFTEYILIIYWFKIFFLELGRGLIALFSVLMQILFTVAAFLQYLLRLIWKPTWCGF